MQLKFSLKIWNNILIGEGAGPLGPTWLRPWFGGHNSVVTTVLDSFLINYKFLFIYLVFIKI